MRHLAPADAPEIFTQSSLQVRDPDGCHDHMLTRSGHHVNPRTTRPRFTTVRTWFTP